MLFLAMSMLMKPLSSAILLCSSTKVNVVAQAVVRSLKNRSMMNLFKKAWSELRKGSWEVPWIQIRLKAHRFVSSPSLIGGEEKNHN